MDSHEPPLPTFLIIGAQKSATRWLRLNLGLHPDVYSAPGELEFFNNIERAEQGVESYRAQFEGWSGEPYLGEATPGYMFWRHDPRVIAGRIRDTVPDVRLIAILRNPVDRAHSAVVHHIEGGSLPAGAQVMDVVRRTPPERDPLGIVSGGWYAASLEPYVEFFGDHLHQRGAHAGAEIDLAGIDGDEAFGVDREERVDFGEGDRLGGSSRAVLRERAINFGELEADDERAASLEEIAT